MSPVAAGDISLVATGDMSPVATGDIRPVATGDVPLVATAGEGFSDLGGFPLTLHPFQNFLGILKRVLGNPQARLRLGWSHGRERPLWVHPFRNSQGILKWMQKNKFPPHPQIKVQTFISAFEQR